MASPNASDASPPGPQRLTRRSRSDGGRVTVELPLEELVRANRNAIIRILLRDLEAQSCQ
jgi:hypothetical protein